MTTSSHDTCVKQVRIADLEARLSEYLRAVRGGESIAVLDRDTPVAQLIPVRDPRTLRVRKPVPVAERRGIMLALVDSLELVRFISPPRCCGKR